MHVRILEKKNGKILILYASFNCQTRPQLWNLENWIQWNTGQNSERFYPMIVSSQSELISRKIRHLVQEAIRTVR